MSADMNWIIGGLTPVWITPDVVIDREAKKITLNCVSHIDLLDGADPYTEINRFLTISSNAINNTQTYNGGYNLRVPSNNPIISVTNGVETWDRCALHPPVITYNEYADYFLRFQLVIEFDLQIGGGFAVYEPPYDTGYPNVTSYPWTDKTAGVGEWAYLGATEIGWMEIIEEQPVKQVLIYGSGCILPAGITVEGSIEGTQQWSVSHEGHESEVYAGRGTQLLTFNFETPTTDIIIYTSTHTPPGTDAYNHGCWPIWIKNVYAE
jgi:hypothetical protein